MKNHIAVIDPGMRVAELDCFNRMSRTSEVPLTYHLPAMFGLESLINSEVGLVGLIVLGSGASVNESLPWQTALTEWLSPRLQAGTPALGLCYGHQLFSALLGGAVDFVRPDQHKFKGIRHIRLEADPLWGGPLQGPLLVTHREHVNRIAPNCSVRAYSAEVPVEAFAHNTLPIWGFQAHPEATPAFAQNNHVPLENPADLTFGNRLVDEFLTFCSPSNDVLNKRRR